jgi:hypothetical protein
MTRSQFYYTHHLPPASCTNTKPNGPNATVANKATAINSTYGHFVPTYQDDNNLNHRIRCQNNRYSLSTTKMLTTKFLPLTVRLTTLSDGNELLLLEMLKIGHRDSDPIVYKKYQQLSTAQQDRFMHWLSACNFTECSSFLCRLSKTFNISLYQQTRSKSSICICLHSGSKVTCLYECRKQDMIIIKH